MGILGQIWLRDWVWTGRAALHCTLAGMPTLRMQRGQLTICSLRKLCQQQGLRRDEASAV
ncbi:hypothetical protein CPB84DRAFT_1794201 [Gymnopilus junonius]|uniref:Uncharacterized protein n=1 Tax=Gymnopilus junonius TaxID=109634 RepID=A0A9P5NAH4_GYMJU|nr:hypothetical protein CPB84DRAFT_1794201 [Gymnopilus junonius]